MDQVVQGCLTRPLLYGDTMSTIDDIDYNSDEYKIPGDITSDVYKVQVPLSVDEFTEKIINGTGVFDVLMSAVSAQLKGEFEDNRITGTEYTKAYIASVELAMNTALQFLLGKDAAYWNAVKSQADAITARIALQTAKYQTEGAKFQAQQAEKQLDLLDKQIEALHGQIDLNLEQQDLVQEQIETQRAQTLDTRTDGAVVKGTVGAQKDLYKQQVDSYKRDAETKMAKIFSDAWITQKTMDEGLTPPSGFNNSSLDSILSKLKLNNGF